MKSQEQRAEYPGIDSLDSYPAIRKDFAKLVGPKAAARIFGENGKRPANSKERKKALGHIVGLLDLLRDDDAPSDPIDEETQNENPIEVQNFDAMIDQSVTIVVHENQQISSDSAKYIDYIFGDGVTESVDLRARDIPAVIGAMAEIGDGFGERKRDPRELITVTSLMLQGFSSYEVEDKLHIHHSQIKPRYEAYRTRIVRKAKQKGIEADKMLSILETHVGARRARVDDVLQTEPTLDYELVGDLSDRSKLFIDDIASKELSAHLNKTDAIAITEAIASMNEPWSRIRNVDQRKRVIFGALIGFTDSEIADMSGKSYNFIKKLWKETKNLTRYNIAEKEINASDRIKEYVELFRQDPTYIEAAKIKYPEAYKLSQLPADTLKTTKLINQNNDKIKKPIVKVRRPTPQSMPKVVEQSEQISLYEQYRSLKTQNKYPVDEDCPRFTTVWGEKTLSALDERFRREVDLQDNPTDIIRERADGTDKTRKPDVVVAGALADLKKMANRAKTDFGDDFQKKKAFDMFTNIVDGPLNTLGDICRAFQAVEPEIENHQVASILVASITDVLRDYESVLVVKR